MCNFYNMTEEWYSPLQEFNHNSQNAIRIYIVKIIHNTRAL